MSKFYRDRICIECGGTVGYHFHDCEFYDGDPMDEFDEDDFGDMDEDEIREALEEAGFDPVDYDDFDF